MGHVVTTACRAQTRASEENWGSFCPWPKGLLPVSSEDRPKRKDGIGGKQPRGLIQSHHFWPDKLVNIYGFVISVELLWFTASLEPAPTSFTFKDGHEQRPRAERQNGHSSGVIHMQEAFWISVCHAGSKPWKLHCSEIGLTSKTNRNHSPRLA